MNKLGLYIHIPFCKQKCKYCDFISFNSSIEEQNLYMESLIKEINHCQYKNKYYKSNNNTLKTGYSDKDNNDLKKVTSIYIGGGTPSYIDSKKIFKIMKTITDNFNIDNKAEITIEINPGTVTEEKLIDYMNCGINRISIGLQSTHDRLLELIGRIHTYDQFLETFNLVKNIGFLNINVDLMLALPTQTEEELEESLDEIIKINPNHISVYSLILEKGTQLENLVVNNKIKLIDDDLERKMYWKSKKILEKNDYNHYEISNFSKKGFESKHNMDCWNQEEYIGFGLGAHSYLNGKRFSNTSNLKDYIENINNNNFEKNIQINEIQDRETRLKEYMMLGFRKINGISISEFERKFRLNPLFYFRFEIDKLTKLKLIEVDLDNIKLTKKGLDFANIVFENFI